MGKIDRECRAVGDIIDHDVTEFESGSVAFKFNMGLDLEFDPKGKDWKPLPEATTVHGQVILVKKDGTLNEDGVKQIRDAFNWDGADWEKLRNNNMAGTRIQVQIKGEMYQGKMNYKASWIYHGEAVPGGIPGTVDQDRFTALQQRYASQTRAICGGNTSPPGKPSAPPPPGQSRVEQHEALTGQKVPF